MSSDEKEQKRISRREFVKGAAVGAAGAAAAGALAACGPTPTPEVIKETVEVEKVVEKEVPVEVTKEVEVIKEVELKPWLPEKWDYEADLVIVGYGGGGVSAAIDAVDAGATVLVLEKDPEPRGGNSGCCGGISCVGQNVEVAFEYLKSMCWGTVSDELIRDHVEAVFELPGWIEQLGGKVFWGDVNTGIPGYNLCTYPLIPGGDRWGGPRSFFAIDKDGARGDGHALFQFAKSCAEARGISVEAGTLKCATPATELIQDPNTKEILGVKALEGVTFAEPPEFTYTGGKEIYVKAKKAVILACGGYENNEEIRKNFAPHAHSAFVTFYGTPYNTGDGMRMAQAVGAKIWHMNKKECHSFACTPLSRELGHARTVSAYGTQIGATASIIVNRDGKRFMREYFNSGHTDRHHAYDEFEHAHIPGDDYEYSDYRNVPFYWVFDDTRMKAGPLGRTGQWTGIHKIYEWSEDNEAELAKGYFIKADTIEELGNMIEIKNFFGEVVGMDAAGLVETVNKYNQYCAAGEDEDFGRPPETLIPLSTPPFYAMEICECQTNTQGGPEFTKYQQTIDADGQPIPRLYNVGENGSIYGFLYNGGGNVPETYATGRIAAKHALTLEPWG